MPSKFLYYGLSKEDYKKCLPLIRRDNFRMDRYASYIGCIIMLILFAVSFAYDKLDVFKWIYGGFAGCFLVLSLLSIIFRKHDEIGIIGYYVIASVYIAFGILLSTSYPPGKATIIYIELLFFSVFFTDKTIRAWIYCLLAGGIYISSASSSSRTPRSSLRSSTTPSASPSCPSGSTGSPPRAVCRAA